jgi:hypothetical protein
VIGPGIALDKLTTSQYPVKTFRISVEERGPINLDVVVGRVLPSFLLDGIMLNGLLKATVF